MIDLIFGVDSPRERHKENISKNPEDYSSLVRLLGARFANYLQDK